MSFYVVNRTPKNSSKISFKSHSEYTASEKQQCEGHGWNASDYRLGVN